MSHSIKKINPSKVPTYTIDESIGNHQNDERILAKVARMNAILAEGGLPDCIYEMQAKIEAEEGYAALLVEEELSVACEPAPEYNSSKPTEKRNFP